MALFDDTFAPYVPFGSRNLSSGDTGTDVAIVQAVYDLMLETMNPPLGPMGSPISITGTYGSSTVQAVKNIQSYFGLSADGIVGPNTYFVFGQGVGSHTTYGGPVYGSRQLEQGMSGGDVTILQNRLNCFRYASIIGKPATGTFDAATASAVLAFKADAASNGDTGFPANAIAGFGFYDATWIYTFAGGRAIQSGRNGFDVVFVQVILKGLGFYSGRITGYYDAATLAAVKAFQTAQGITSDGVVGPVTFYRIGKNNVKAAPKPLGIAWPPTAPPSPSVTVCSVGLTSQTMDLHPYGEATHVINQLEGFESLDVVGNMLYPPSHYGSSYTGYVFTLTNPSTSTIVATVKMTRVSTSTNPSDWAGAYSPGVSTIPEGIVRVYPVTSTNVKGPLVLEGNLQDCQ
ncbi:MAG: peptidoglycan-binding protein [Firmicutes bacterium]|nr:peptidoglycan-binding protein [Bacillota bacterium]